MPTTDDFEKICQLLSTPPINAKLALELLKGQPELKEQVEEHFRPLLDLYKKKTIRSISGIIKEDGLTQLTREKFLWVLDHPEYIKYLSNNLYLGHYKFTELPTGTCDIIQLKKLNLNYNKLTTLPREIEKLQNLESLNLRGNKLSSLPDSIGNLPKLKELTLMNNELTTLPKSMLKLKLDRLEIEWTQISEEEAKEWVKAMPDTQVVYKR